MVRLVGDAPELGGWDLNHGLVMQEAADGQGLWIVYGGSVGGGHTVLQRCSSRRAPSSSIR
eukprot:6766446-Pyramimonas_sp.AAC.3